MTGGKVAMFYRAKSVAADRVWSVGPQSSSLTNNSGSPAANNSIEWGHCASGTAETSWEELHYRFDQSYSPALSAGFSNPADLFGRSYAGVGAATYVDGGVRITAIDGAAREGETYNIDTRYRYPIDRILWTESQSPRVGWRSTADNTSTLIPFLLNANESSPGSSTQGILGDMLILHMSAINFANFTIEYYAGGSWNVAATVDTALTGGTWNATRTSNTITMPTGGSNTSKSHLFQNECAGWTAKIGSSLYRIARNAPGVLAAGNGSNFKRVRLEVEGTTGSTEVGALELWPDSVTVAINLRGIQGSAWGIRIAAEHTVDDDYRIGQLMLGRAFITGYQYARGRVMTYRAQHADHHHRRRCAAWSQGRTRWQAAPLRMDRPGGWDGDLWHQHIAQLHHRQHERRVSTARQSRRCWRQPRGHVPRDRPASALRLPAQSAEEHIDRHRCHRAEPAAAAHGDDADDSGGARERARQ